MGQRRRLKGGAPRLLGNHGGAEGAAYRRAYDALEEEYGPFSALGRLEAGRVAVAYVQLQATTRALVAEQQKRRRGKGRRPNAQQIERLARRQGLADNSYAQALARLQAMALAGPRSADDFAARVRQGSPGPPGSPL
jgi:hypothetical protein